MGLAAFIRHMRLSYLHGSCGDVGAAGVHWCIKKPAGLTALVPGLFQHRCLHAYFSGAVLFWDACINKDREEFL